MKITASFILACFFGVVNFFHVHYNDKLCIIGMGTAQFFIDNIILSWLYSGFLIKLALERE